MNNLSTCIIVKNEEDNLRTCLDSVKDISDEIIIVDTGSQDSTIDIANQYTDKIYEFEWIDDFASARNYSIEKASKELILIIDADEQLKNPNQIQLIKNSNDNSAAWLVTLISTFHHNGKSEFRNKAFRLFRNLKTIRFKGMIHEQITESIAKNNLHISDSNVIIHHKGYDISPNAFQKKQLRNLNILNLSIKKDKRNPYLFYQRSKTLEALNEFAKAAQDIEIALNSSAKTSMMRPAFLNQASLLAFKRQEFSKAIYYADESLSIIPMQAFANFILAELYLGKKEFPKAFSYYKNMQIAARNINSISLLSGDFFINNAEIYYKLGKSLLGMNELERAKIEFLNSLKENPAHIHSIVGLANIEYKLANYINSRDLLESAFSIEPNNKPIKKYLNIVNSKIIKSEEQIKPEIIEENSKPLISLCMIVKNEESNLVDCLKSTKELVDEMIIVDTGSSDKTIEIIKEFGANLHHFNWIDDFAAARNESIKHAQGEWILYLDADERINNNDYQMLRTFLANLPNNIGGVICTIESDHSKLDGSSEKHRGGYPRIFRNYGYPNIYFKGRVHEQITPSIFELGKSFVKSDIIIEHLGYNQEREIMEKKVKRNYNMLIKHVKEEPDNAYAWYQLGQTLAHMKLNKEAEDAIRFSVKMGSLSDSVYASASATLAQITGNKKNFKEALYWAEESLSKAPNQLYSTVLKAYALFYLKRINEAEKEFYKAIKLKSEKRSVPMSGFDIEISDDVIKEGLNKIEKERKKAE